MAEDIGALSGTGDIELEEWIDSLEYVIHEEGRERAQEILEILRTRAAKAGVAVGDAMHASYVNTIPPGEEPEYPGDLELERRIEAAMRWNAAAMVARANRAAPGIGGHLSAFASAAVLYNVGFNHFFRGPGKDRSGDHVYFQGHSSPGIYARAFVEGRLGEEDLENYRRELGKGRGLPSYPHPWLMPDFWQFPTVSMGLGPIMAVYQARFDRYLAARGIKDTSSSRVWAFLGDGETDEPEALAGLRLAARDGLSNLIFVVNCNLQRLDGPVRGNGKIISELEGVFRGSGWRVIKVLWSREWDPLFARDSTGALVRRLGEMVDGEFQTMMAHGPAYIREHLFNTPELRDLVAGLAEEDIGRLLPGGLDPVKVHAAFSLAVKHDGRPTVVLAQSIKGFDLGPNVAGRNMTHEAKDLSDEDFLSLRDRLGIPLSDEAAVKPSFWRPDDGSREIVYMHSRRQTLGGYVPERQGEFPAVRVADQKAFAEFAGGSERKVSTTGAFGRLFTNLLRDPEIGSRIVPIIPDESRTFGLESLFRQVGIYAPSGQRYVPVDAGTMLPYREEKDGQLFEEGITEQGAMASFIAAGTSGATHGVAMVPFYWFYSKFGLQRSFDLAWAAGELRAKGFLVGGLSGRTQLQGEGLQHQDGESHLLALTVPNLVAYDAAYAYEVAAIVKDGLRRMFEEKEDVYYYITVGNESYAQPPMPDGVESGILRGLYLFAAAADLPGRPRVRLLGSGAILNEAVKAKEILEGRLGVAAEVWSVTSYKELYRDALEAERQNLLHPEAKERQPYVSAALQDALVTVAATDYVKALPSIIARFVPGPLVTLGTDGFGRSATHEELRDFFEVDDRHIAAAALAELSRQGALSGREALKALRELDVDPGRLSPVVR